MTTMRLLRALAGLLGVLIAVCAPTLLLAPVASADPPFRIPGYVTDRAGALKNPAKVRAAVDQLYDQPHRVSDALKKSVDIYVDNKIAYIREHVFPVLGIRS